MNVQHTLRISLVMVVMALFSLRVPPVALAQSGNPADVVLSEVMFNAAYETSAYGYGEWIEIYNRGSAAVDLAGWSIEDNSGTQRTISASMCPGGSCQIPAGGCWLIAWDSTYLQTEFDAYVQPPSPQVDAARTIFLGNEIGNGLSNSADEVILLFSDGRAVDCVSWASPSSTVCQALTYVPGADGADTNLANEGNAQSITNVQGRWYYHEPNASPYSCKNTAASGVPTAVTLSTLSARAGWTWDVGVAVGGFLVLALLGGRWVLKRRRAAGQENA